MLDEILRAQRLIRKRHIHHARRVPFRRRQIDQATFGQEIDAAAVFE